jgi:hypothetical protein
MENQHELERRRELRRQYGQVFDLLSKTLFDADPIGISCETNTDEYDPEVGTILPRLPDATSATDVKQIVHEEFCRWFGADDAGPAEHYRAVSETIWIEWQGHLNAS